VGSAGKNSLAARVDGIVPDAFPVFSKPIYNLRGMGMETRIFTDEESYLANRDPGHMWTELLTGEHLSTDLAVADGTLTWCRHVAGKPGPHQTFDYWTVLASTRPPLETYLAEWVQQHFPSYTGMMNLETIGGKIIEGHLRFADQWPDLYGPGWLDALVRLYEKGEWVYNDTQRRDGYSVVLFAGFGARYKPPPADLLADIRSDESISSVQITFYEDRPVSAHAMPPGGFRVAIVNTWDLEAGLAARTKLGHWFWESRQLSPRHRTKTS